MGVVLAGAAIAAGAGIYGAHKAKQGQKEGLESGERSTTAALNWEKERFEKETALLKAQWDAAQANKRALMRRYGLNPPEPGAGMTLGGLAGVPPPAGMTPPPTGPGMAPEGPPMAPGVPPAAPVGPRGRTLGDLENWNDWRRYAPVQ